jgi:hypothetical protein
MGGVVGLGLGLEAERQAAAQGKPVSWVAQAAVLRGAIGLGAFIVGLIIFLIVISGHHDPSFGVNTCTAIPKPGPSWTCQGGMWVSQTP